MYIFNGESHASKDALRESVRKFLYARIHAVIIDGEKDFIALHGLLMGHPNALQKLKDVRCFKITKGWGQHRGGPRILVLTKHGTWDISWNKAIRGKAPTQNSMLLSAMREAVSQQVVEFKTKTEKKCVICGKNGPNLDVDHMGETFAILKSQFVADHPPPARFDKNPSGRYAFYPSDCEYTEKWKRFHAARAKLRLLCRNCHLKETKNHAAQ